MKDGVDTPRSYVGHTGSVTVVTHNVITSGQLPKHMGWTDEGYRDVAGILGDPEPAEPRPALHHQQRHHRPDQAAAGRGLPEAGRLPRDREPGREDLHDQPEGVRRLRVRRRRVGLDHHVQQRARVHDRRRLAQARRHQRAVVHPRDAPCSRFWVHSGYPPAVPSFAYDTTKLPAVLYPLDSDRYMIGKDPAHQGGDVWAADAAVEIMRNDHSWNGIFVTLPGVDKAAHMWGGVTDPGPTGADGDAMTHLAAATAEADQQVAQDHGRAQGPGRARQHPRGAHRRPRLGRGQALLRQAGRRRGTTATTTGTTATSRTTSSPTTSRRTPCCRSSTPATSGSPTATRCCASG